ncbi:MAG TPA: hypothetical protein VML01_01810 [Bryobacterales bacterium]|nr:hypothetical protein [Bryobacterales bacterium]
MGQSDPLTVDLKLESIELSEASCSHLVAFTVEIREDGALSPRLPNQRIVTGALQQGDKVEDIWIVIRKVRKRFQSGSTDLFGLAIECREGLQHPETVHHTL